MVVLPCSSGSWRARDKWSQLIQPKAGPLRKKRPCHLGQAGDLQVTDAWSELCLVWTPALVLICFFPCIFKSLSFMLRVWDQGEGVLENSMERCQTKWVFSKNKCSRIQNLIPWGYNSHKYIYFVSLNLLYCELNSKYFNFQKCFISLVNILSPMFAKCVS